MALAFLTGCGGSKKSATKASGGPPPANVTVAEVAQRTVPLQLTAIGNAQPYRTVQVKSMVGGQISRVLFQQGDYVKAGQLLFQIDKRPYQAALDQAVAKLAEDKATAAYNQTMANKYRSLAQQGVIAQQVSQQQEALAVSNAATVKADEAAIETARVNLSFTDIRAPINARAGALLVDVGNLVQPNGSTALTTLNQVEPIYVQFSIPEAQLAAVRANGGIGHLKVYAHPQGDESSSAGTLTFVNNAVDATTGTIQLMGTFPNNDRRLWPGEFLNVDLMLGEQRNAIVVPATAVQTGQQGQFVYVVRADNTAVIQAVASPRTYNGLAVIQTGLKPGERVIVAGQIQVVPNGKVEVVQTVPTSPSTQQVAQNGAATDNNSAQTNDPSGAR